MVWILAAARRRETQRVSDVQTIDYPPPIWPLVLSTAFQVTLIL